MLASIVTVAVAVAEKPSESVTVTVAVCLAAVVKAWLTLAPVAVRLSELLGRPVPLVANWLDGVECAPGAAVLQPRAGPSTAQKMQPNVPGTSSFFAILVDRRAVSLHSLAVAALVILAIEPEVVVSPGFEMSFCATASLIALSEIWRRPIAPAAP